MTAAAPTPHASRDIRRPRAGGIWTREDLEQYRVVERPPRARPALGARLPAPGRSRRRRARRAPPASRRDPVGGRRNRAWARRRPRETEPPRSARPAVPPI